MTAWLLRPCSSRRYLVIWRGVAALLGLRAALGPYRQLAGQPSELFQPVPFLSWLDHMPSAAVIGVVQVVGLGAAVAAFARPRSRWALLAAWSSLLVLAGLKTSLGKVLHNDLLLLCATVPFLLIPAPDPDAETDEASARRGLPVQTATAAIALVYFIIGFQKLRHSGLSWVTGDNMRWILYGGATNPRAPSTSPALFLAERAWLSHVLAAGTLVLELGFPAVLLWDRMRTSVAVSAAAFHGGTWLVLGLDYWAWAAVDLILLIPWDRLMIRQSPPRARDGPARRRSAPRAQSPR
jgi:hypothetical protein